MTTTPSTSTTPQVRAPRFSVAMSREQATFIRSLPNRCEVVNAALSTPIPVEEWLASVNQGLIVARASSLLLTSRYVRDRESSPETLQWRRERTLDRILRRLPKDVLTGEVIEDLDRLIPRYVRLKDSPRANTDRLSMKVDLALSAALLDQLRTAAASLGISRSFLIRSLIASHVPYSRQRGGFLLPGEPDATPLPSATEVLESLQAGLLALATREPHTQALRAA